jgi:hypothetical protein
VSTGSERLERFGRVEQEIAREKAAALGRAGDRLETALADVAALGEALGRASDARVRARLAADYEAARQRALAARLALLVQREAIGLRHHRTVDEQFPEPPRLR